MSHHSTSASVIYKNERRRKTGHNRTYNTNLLNLVENKLHCKRNCHERKKLFEIRRFEVAQAHFPIAASARTDELQEIESNYSGWLSHVSVSVK